MIPIPWSPINMDEEGQESKNRFSRESPHKSSSADVGLRILILQLSHGKSNVVIKPTLMIKKPTFLANRIDPASSYEYSSFLKSCCLCNKNLSLDKDVFMYRGDQGFCSVECRSRQIYLDEMKEIEESTRKSVASFLHCRPSDRCETRALLEEFRQRRKPLSCQKDRAIVLL